MNTSQCERLKSERKRLGLTQADAAVLAGVARETWGRYESGKLKPGMAVLTAFAERGADMSYLLTGHNVGAEAEQLETTALPYVGVQLYAEKLMEASGLGVNELPSKYENRIVSLTKKFATLDEQAKLAVEAMVDALLTKK